jgi:branched-chain amino acid transport system permease protein
MLGDYHITILVLMGIWIVVALGLNIISGYVGQFNLGIGVYMGTGAYTSALLTTAYGFSFWSALPLALLMSALAGFLAGLPSLRVREDSLAVISIGLVFVFESLLIYLPYFGGPVGIGKIPVPAVNGEAITKIQYLALVWLSVTGLVLLTLRLKYSWIGLAWESIREDELAARVIGTRPERFKLYAFAIGATYAGLGGVLYAHFMNYITPYDFGFLPSIYVLVMVVFGGMGTVRGPVFGATFLTALPEISRDVQEYRNLIYGGLLVAMMLVQPKGLLGDGSFVWGLLSDRARRHAVLVRLRSAITRRGIF